jgi:SAM-dependent methyltransferase
MREELIAKLVCPYCLEKFRLASGAQVKDGRVKYGLLSCTCFDFPIVDSVLMLGLTKGLGGAEEHMQPYVPLQAAAMHYLKSGDVAGLRSWIEKHVPLIAMLWRDDITYTEFLKARNKRVMPYVIRDLQKASRFDFLGWRGERDIRSDKGLLLRVLETRLGSAAAAAWRQLRPAAIEGDFYYSRFTHVDAPQMEKLLASVAVDGPILSLCCGHGIFELVAKWRWPNAEIVSVDGQLLNLLAVQKFFNPTGDFICHNLELPFPFQDGAFTGSFSSTCLQEIPSRAHFVREQIRSTAPDGWCLFERPWWTEPRVKPLREYRFVQNHHSGAADLHKLISSCAGDRTTFSTWYPYDVVTGWSPEWTATPPSAEVQPSTRTGDMNVVVTTRDLEAKAGAPASEPLERAQLTVNPRYRRDVESSDSVFRLQWEGKVARNDKAVGLQKEVRVPEREMHDDATVRRLFEMGVLVPLPRTFSSTLTGILTRPNGTS